VGDREATLLEALARLDATEGVQVVKTSGIYETDQGPFLNLVALVHSSLEPLALLAEAKRIERELGRQPRRRWGPREIDIDLLLSAGLEMATPDLTVPHPALADRAFVLIPLAELDPDVRLPDGRRVGDLAASDEGVRLWREGSVAPGNGNVKGLNHRDTETTENGEGEG
jgi:2-amino-4-hydroxy-6-hydroxymethyldihydropteridine diphosphokinase